MEPSDALHAFRHSFYKECLYRRADALFELTDAILSAGAAAPSPVHLSLQPAHRRGWGSFYPKYYTCHEFRTVVSLQ